MNTMFHYCPETVEIGSIEVYYTVVLWHIKEVMPASGAKPIINVLQ
jgi:hypothetical protein